MSIAKGANLFYDLGLKPQAHTKHTKLLANLLMKQSTPTPICNMLVTMAL
jgi:hypothetical protein